MYVKSDRCSDTIYILCLATYVSMIQSTFTNLIIPTLNYTMIGITSVFDRVVQTYRLAYLLTRQLSNSYNLKNALKLGQSIRVKLLAGNVLRNILEF